MNTQGPKVPLPDKDKIIRVAKKWPLENWIALAALVAVLLGSILAVAIFKRPGQMGVIESQSMDMSKMRPPVGAVPVVLSRVERRSVGKTITYTGTVRAFIDEDVNARVAGTIASLPVYPGDRVGKGQLLVQLDPSGSEYQTRAEEARLAAEAQQHNVLIAREELQQKTEESQATAAQVKQAQQAVKDVEADYNYWAKEIKREQVLLKEQVISQDEYDKEYAQFKSAEAKLQEARQKTVEISNRQQAAQEAVEAAHHHIMHQATMARQAAIAAKTAIILQSYTRIVASGNAVVTQRVVSPGVVVTPGTLILKLAQIDQVRVQASISTTNLGDVAVGDQVTIRTKVAGVEAINARITAIFPTADPASRTTIVECLIPNPGHKLLPGQYAVMEITSGNRFALAVPTSAVVWRNGQATVWRTSGTPKVAQAVAVTTGDSNADYTEIASGLNEGEYVVAMGQTDLQPGTSVVATQWGAEGPAKLPEVKETGVLRLDSSNQWRTEFKGEKLSISLTMANVPAKGGNNSIVVTVRDKSGKPISGARIKGKTSMPAMNMEGPDVQATTGSDGQARLSTFFMTGPWHAEMTVESGSVRENLAFDIEVL